MTIKDEFDEIYEVDSNGIPDPRLLKVVKVSTNCLVYMLIIISC